MNDNDRAEWVQNVEGLYLLQQASRLSERAWIRANRELIDQTAREILGRDPE